MSKRFYLVAYDISDMAVERRAIKLLKQVGMRYQYSVFICHMTQVQREKLVGGLEKLYAGVKKADADDGAALFRIALFPLCETCATARQEIGRDFSWPTGSIVVT